MVRVRFGVAVMAEPASITLRCSGACTASIELESLSATVETLKLMIGENMGTFTPPPCGLAFRS